MVFAAGRQKVWVRFPMLSIGEGKDKDKHCPFKSFHMLTNGEGKNKDNHHPFKCFHVLRNGREKKMTIIVHPNAISQHVAEKTICLEL